jgi:hypothetical protein
MANARCAIRALNFFSPDPDRHSTETGNQMGQLYTAPSKLEREQTGKAATGFLIEGRHDPVNGLMLTRNLAI